MVRLSFSIAVLAIGAAACRPHTPASSGVVGDSVALGDSAYGACRGVNGDSSQACYEHVLLPLVHTHGVRVAMGALNRLATRDDHVRVEGHVYAHGIGIAAGKAGGEVGSTFASCSETFQSGCYHGVIQAYFETVHAIDTKTVNGLCRSYSGPDGDRWLRFQCVHGMGHGLTMFHKHHLPRALEGCDLLADGWDRESCFGGAFMENIVNATVPHHPANALSAPAGGGHQHGPAEPAFKALDPLSPLYPCTIMAERFLNACYGMQTAAILFQNHGDIGAAARTCEQASPIGMRYVCHLSLGRDIYAYAKMRPRDAIRLCSLASAEYQPWCHMGVVKNFVDPRPEDGFAYCRDVPGGANKLKCYAGVGEQVASLRNSLEERGAMCDAAEPAYRAACRFGAQVTGEIPLGMPVVRTPAS